jgi:hypothetical protein
MISFAVLSLLLSFPSGKDTVWTHIYSQHIECVTVLDSNAASIIASRRNKFFITHNGGATWEPHSQFDPNYLIRQIIAFDKCGQSMLINAVAGKSDMFI